MEMLSPEVEARIRALAITARPQQPRPQLRTSPYHEQALSAIFLCKLLFAIGAKYCLIYEDDWLSVCDSLEYALQANNATYQSGATDATFVTLEPQIRRLVEILQRYSPQTIIPASLSDTSSFMLEARIADGDQRSPRTQIGGLETKVTFVFLNSPWFRQDPGEDIRFVHVWLPSQFCYAEIVWALHSVQACNVKENAHFYTYAPDDLESFPFALSQIYPTLGTLSLASEIIYVLTDRTSPIYIAGEAYGNVWKMNGRVVLKGTIPQGSRLG
ncbi:hypothetical protein BV25DRAFT_1045844 [Artomyces pyxidatus]|uniref:Uncharacterized protein n=1 Tax=Artomyces pyxidatus TaxID=48021 RepID=A0ACB8SV82_9AGAM|nr:hypothetical protein BV25DRAFT_1045844 [Artomyces pyxidatus]